jgi:DNA polymerase III delta prime subunit
MTDPDPTPQTGPYARAAAIYWRAGWRGILPLPARAKKPVPAGYTGAQGAWPSYPDVHTWTEGPEGAGNLALRMPHHAIGLDVDDYAGKGGGTTLRTLEAKHGPLPPTWRSTSRNDGVSGIRLYRVPEGLAWPGDLRGGIEIIQHRHRYTVAWPSVHPETGGTYRWIDPHGNDTLGVVPGVDDLPDLPPAWVEGITGGQAAADTARADLGDQGAATWLEQHGGGAPCRAVRAALARHLSDLTTPGGSRHDAALRATQRLAHLAAEGHPGTAVALEGIRAVFIKALHDGTPRDVDPGEWRRMLVGAINIAAVAHPAPTGGDPCDNPFHGLLDRKDTPSWPPPTSNSAPSTPATTPNAPASSTSTTTPDTGSSDSPPNAAAPATPPDDELEQEIGRRQLLAIEVERQRAQRGARRLLDEEEAASLAEHNPTRLIDGATFILDAPEHVPAVWGHDDDVLWAEGESLMLVGPPGVGKTTLAAQVIRARLALTTDPVLGLNVTPTTSRVLYLAMDRPAQAARAMRRLFHAAEREQLAERLVVWKGPPPGDVAKNTEILVQLAAAAGADTIVIDSVKDAAIGLTEDEVAAGYNRARQAALTVGVQLLELHHLVKRGANGTKPNTLADVYGSAWLTAGAGSVVLLWGAAGDPIVDLVHLKQPAAEVGPHRVIHDHDHGTSEVWHNTDVLAIAKASGVRGVTAKTVAAALFSTDKPSASEVEKARRRLLKLTKDGHLEYREGNEAAAVSATWTRVENDVQTLTGTLTHPSADDTCPVRVREGQREGLTCENTENVRVREGASGHPHAVPPPYKGGTVRVLPDSTPETEEFCRHCGAQNDPTRTVRNCTSCGRRP